MRLLLAVAVVAAAHYVRKEARADGAIPSFLEEGLGRGELTADAMYKDILDFQNGLHNRRSSSPSGESFIQGGMIESLSEVLAEEKAAMHRIEVTPHMVLPPEKIPTSMLERAEPAAAAAGNGANGEIGNAVNANPVVSADELEQQEDQVEKGEHADGLQQEDDPADEETVANEAIKPEDLYYHFKACAVGQAHCPATARFTIPVASYPIEMHQTALQKEQLKVCDEFKKAYDAHKSIIDSSRTAIVTYKAQKDLAKLNEIKNVLERVTEDLKQPTAQRCQFVIVFGRKGMDGNQGKPGLDGRMGSYGSSGPMGLKGEVGFDGRGGAHFATMNEVIGLGILNFMLVFATIQKGKKLRAEHGIKDGDMWDTADHIDTDEEESLAALGGVAPVGQQTGPAARPTKVDLKSGFGTGPKADSSDSSDSD